MLLALTLTLVALVVVNTVFLTWATVLDARHSAALARALGATAHDERGALRSPAAAALVGAILGIPGGVALTALSDSFRDGDPPLWSLLAVVLGTLLVVAAPPPSARSAPAGRWPTRCAPSSSDGHRGRLARPLAMGTILSMLGEAAPR